MKIKALALAVFAALSTGAAAADVSIYGVVDTGLVYQDIKGEDAAFTMESGNYAGPRFGIKGTEKLSDDLTLSFILESGFKSDSGALADDGKLFNREEQIALSGTWGTFGAGRVAAFTSGSSSLSWYWDMDPFETGYWDAGIQATQQNNWVLRSNTLYYVTPVVNGFKAGFQYSFNDESDSEAAKWSDNNAFYNLALRWDGESARIVGGLETTQMDNGDDKYSVKLAAACTPNNAPFTYYVGASWYKNYYQFSESTWNFDDRASFTQAGQGNDAHNVGDGLEAYSGFVGVKYTHGNTDYLGLLQYMDGENKSADAGTEKDYSRYVASLGLHHHLSARTMLYAVGSYAAGNDLLEDTDTFTAHFGLTHYF